MPDLSATTLDARNATTPPSGELALRIRGGDYHGRVVRIRVAQCTIGSASDCTLRLTTPGVRPLHCIILRGEAGATVRRWSPDTQLNGRAFSDALLSAGDRLEIGPIELEVLDESELGGRRNSVSPEAERLPVAQLAGEIVQHLRRDLQRKPSGEKQKLQRKRLAKSNRRIKQLEAELDQLQDMLQAAQSGDALTAPSENTGNAEHEQQRLAWETERRNLLKSLEEKTHAQQRLEATMDELRKQLEQEHLASAARRQHEQEQLAEERRQLQAKADDLEQLQAWCNEVERQSQSQAEEFAASQAAASSLQSRLAELEKRLAAAEAERASAGDPSPPVQRQDNPSQREVQPAEADQLRQQTEQLAAAQAAAEELRRAAEQSSQEWSQREAELTQRIACLEKLAANLEDELRAATAQPDKVELAEEQRHSLEQQLAIAQRQWAEQRQLLEEQSLSAHQQLQDAENQIVSMRDALHSTQAQVRERDELLAQLRDEVRAQLAAWQTEREQLLANAASTSQRDGAGTDRSDESQEEVSTYDRDVEDASTSSALWSRSRFADSFADRTNADESEDRYADRGLLARGPQQPESVPEEEEGPVAQDGGVDNVLARLGAAGIWRNQGSADDAQTASRPDMYRESSEQEYTRDENERSDDLDHTPDPSVSSEYSRPAEEEQPPVIQAPSQAAADSSSSDEEESIEAYMNRLMKRVRGDAVAQAYTFQETPSQGAATESTEIFAAVSPESEAAQTPVTPEEFLPRKSAPEQASDLAAMRELAVHSARQAIDRSTQQRFKKNSLGTTLAACALVGLSVGLFGWGFDTGNTLAWAGSGVALGAGMYLVLRRLRMRNRAKAQA